MLFAGNGLSASKILFSLTSSLFVRPRRRKAVLSKILVQDIYREDITPWGEDMNFIFEWQNNGHKKIKFISSSRHVMFFLLYRQNDIDKIIEGNYRNYVIDKLTCEIMENKPLGSRM